jgi:hypothetical protein
MCTQSVVKLVCVLFIYLFIAVYDILIAIALSLGESPEMHSELKQTIQPSP